MYTPLLYSIASLLSFAAAVLHAALTPEHWEEWWGYGAFFLALYIAQGVYGLLLLLVGWRAKDGQGSGRAFFVFGIIGNLLSVAMYVVSRITGIPVFGPEAGEVEPVTVVGLVTKGIEIALIVNLVLLARSASTLDRTPQYSPVV